MRRLIASELIGDQHPRRRALPLEEFAEEPLGGLSVAPALDEDVEDVAVLVDGPPQILTTAVDRHEHLVEVPLVAGRGWRRRRPAAKTGPNLAHTKATPLGRVGPRRNRGVLPPPDTHSQ
jgi:hypothetical protein